VIQGGNGKWSRWNSKCKFRQQSEREKSRQQSRQAGSRFQERGLARSSSGKRLASLRKVRAFYTGFLGTAHVLEGGWRQKAGWGYRR